MIYRFPLVVFFKKKGFFARKVCRRNYLPFVYPWYTFGIELEFTSLAQG